jgi:uncharacterized protein (DUF488 family)
MSKKLWTIGHSTRSIENFISLLKENEIDELVDVRSLPGSKKFPQFNQENLSESLKEAGIAYDYEKGLGGLRKKNPDSHNTVWRNASFRAYADYMETPEFEEAAEKLVQMAQQKRICICCAEAVWWRCHRSMIADYLKSKEWEVYHIMGPGKTTEHPYTQPAKVINGELVYGSGEETSDEVNS